MILAATATAAGTCAVFAWVVARGWFATPGRTAVNVRGVDVPVGAGVLLAPSAVLAGAGVALLADRTHTHLVVASLVALGFGLLGLFDDWYGSAAIKGFRGHLRALAAGRPTSGTAKLIGGGLLSLAAVWSLGRGIGETLIGAALVALAANAANLFDRAPGRVAKVTLALGGGLLAIAGQRHADQLLVAAGMVGAMAGLLGFDLRERLMLGDAGANSLGASLGMGVVLVAPVPVQVVVLGLVVACNVAGELVSFSAVIERSAPLRAVDLWGRRAVGGG